MKSAAGNLMMDAFSVSKSFARATLGSVRRLYSTPAKPPTTVASVGNQQGMPFSSGDVALTDADGFVADADHFLIMGKEAEPSHAGMADGGKPPPPSQGVDTIVLADLPASGIQNVSNAAKSERGGKPQAGSEGQVAALGEAAIAVNEAEEHVVEVAEELEACKSSQGLQGAVQDLKGGGRLIVQLLESVHLHSFGDLDIIFLGKEVVRFVCTLTSASLSVHTLRDVDSTRSLLRFLLLLQSLLVVASRSQ